MPDVRIYVIGGNDVRASECFVDMFVRFEESVRTAQTVEPRGRRVLLVRYLNGALDGAASPDEPDEPDQENQQNDETKEVRPRKEKLDLQHAVHHAQEDWSGST